jgi:magnesium-transporting ATPase (P-type)
VRSQRQESVSPSALDPEETADLLLRDLRSSPKGLSGTEAKRRLLQYGPNELQRRRGREWPRALVRQLTHPLALLLWVAAGLLVIVGSHVVTVAVVLIIMVNAAFSFVQELQAERVVEALAKYLPQRAKVEPEASTATANRAECHAGVTLGARRHAGVTLGAFIANWRRTAPAVTLA